MTAQLPAPARATPCAAQPVKLSLPWPAKELSPNAALHWGSTARAKKKYRHDCRILTLAAKVPSGVWGDIELRFLPPDRRAYDMDNLVARMKAGLDGIADGLRVNDRQFRLKEISIGPPRAGGMVEVTISELV